MGDVMFFTEGGEVRLPRPEVLEDRLLTARATLAQLEGALATAVAVHNQLPSPGQLDNLARAATLVEVLERAVAANRDLWQTVATSENVTRRNRLRDASTPSTTNTKE